MDPHPYEPLGDTPLAMNVNFDPITESWWEFLFPELLPSNSVNEQQSQWEEQLVEAVPISTSEDTSHNHHHRFTDTISIAAHTQLQPPQACMASGFDPSWSLPTAVQPSGANPVAPLADFHQTAARPMSQPGPTRTRPRANRPSPYQSGKDDSDSHPSDVGHIANTTQKVTARRHRRYLSFILSITRY